MTRALALLAGAAACAWAWAQSWSAPPVDQENPRYLLAGQADSAIARGEYEQAAARLIEAISICPDCPDNALLLSNLGMVYAYDGRDSLALATLDRALALAPSMRTVIANRGRLLLRMGRDAEALQAYSRLIGLDSLNLEARYYRGLLALYAGDLATAELDMAILRDSVPEQTATARALAALYTRTGRNGSAAACYRQLIADEPAPEYYSLLAQCYLADEKLTEASATIGEGLEKYPEDGELYYCRAWLNKLLFRPAEARADGRKATSLGVPETKVRELLR